MLLHVSPPKLHLSSLQSTKHCLIEQQKIRVHQCWDQMQRMIKLLIDSKVKLPAGHFSSHEGRDCCQVEWKASEFRAQPHRWEVPAREGRYSVLVFSSAALFLWYPSLHLWVLFLTSFLTSISAVFLTPFHEQCSITFPTQQLSSLPASPNCLLALLPPCHTHAKNSLTPTLGAQQYSSPSDLPPKSHLSIDIPLTSTQPLFLPSFDLAQITV